jgi:signal transduction histidine kinase
VQGPISLVMSRKRLWVAFAGVGAALIGVYFVLPSARAQNVLYEVIGVLGVAGILLGVRIHRPPRRGPWYLLATGIALLVAGDVAWTVYAWIGPTPYPSLADILYLAGYPFVAAGLIRLRRPASRTVDRARLAETAIITTGVALLAWEPFIEPYALDPALSFLERSVSLAYPLADLLMIAVLVRLAVGVGSRAPSYGLLLTGVVAALTADVIYAALATSGTYYTGHPVDAGWLVEYTLFGAAALHPSMRGLSDPAPESPVRVGPLRLTVLAGSTLLAPAVIWYENAADQPRSISFLLVVAAMLFLLVVYRMSLLVQEVAAKANALDRQGENLRTAVISLRRAEDERKALLERTLRAAEEERVRIAADLHDGPIQRLSVLGYTLERGRLKAGGGDLEGALELLDRAQGDLSSEVQDLRRLMASLRPPALDQEGLEGALRDQVAAFRDRARIETEVRTELAGRPSPEVETVLYRVVQEALQNVAKHANASKVSVRVVQRNGSVELAVNDDGVGFDPRRDMAGAREHFGLSAMREQVTMAGGQWEVASAPGRGTSVKAVLPTTRLP